MVSMSCAHPAEAFKLKRPNRKVSGDVSAQRFQVSSHFGLCRTKCEGQTIPINVLLGQLREFGDKRGIMCSDCPGDELQVMALRGFRSGGKPIALSAELGHLGLQPGFLIKTPGDENSRRCLQLNAIDVADAAD